MDQKDQSDQKGRKVQGTQFTDPQQFLANVNIPIYNTVGNLQVLNPTVLDPNTQYEYIVTLHHYEDLEAFYQDMETPGGNLYIPHRAVTLLNRQEISRNTHYMLTPVEAETLRNDPRVKSVEVLPKLRGIAPRLGYTQSSSNWDRSSTVTAGMLNWGLLRSTLRNNISNWGGYTANTKSVSSSVTIPQSGKNVDVVIVDETLDITHPEFSGRVNQIDWFRLYDSAVKGNAAVTIKAIAKSQVAGVWYTDVTMTGAHGISTTGTTGGANIQITCTSDPRFTESTFVATVTSPTQLRCNTYANLTTISNASATGTLTGRYDYQYGLGDHGTHTTGTATGLNQGWARDANIYNFYFQHAQIATSSIYDYIRAFHKNKPINPATGRRNPTITNNSWGFYSTLPYSIWQFPTSLSSVNYRGTTVADVNFAPERMVCNELGVLRFNDNGGWPSTFDGSVGQSYADQHVFVSNLLAAGSNVSHTNVGTRIVTNSTNINSSNVLVTTGNVISSIGNLRIPGNWDVTGLRVRSPLSAQTSAPQSYAISFTGPTYIPFIHYGSTSSATSTAQANISCNLSISNSSGTVHSTFSYGQNLFLDTRYSIKNFGLDGTNGLYLTGTDTYTIKANIQIDTTGVTGVTYTDTTLSIPFGGNVNRIPNAVVGGPVVTTTFPTTVSNIAFALRGTSGLTANTTPAYGTNDDGFWTVQLPFPINYMGGTYKTLYVTTNGYIITDVPNELSTTSGVADVFPAATGGISVFGDDNSCQTLYTGLTTATVGSRVYVIRYEGTNATTGTPGSPNLVYEATFYEATPNQIDLQIGQNARSIKSLLFKDLGNKYKLPYGYAGNAPARDSATDTSIISAIADGIIVVASAGNDGYYCDITTGPDYNNYAVYGGVTYYYNQGSTPGATPGVICVGAIGDYPGSAWENKAAYSETGPRVDIYAPGSDIISSIATSSALGVLWNGARYNKLSGTSMASPQVTGVLACLLEIYPRLTPAEALALIRSYSTTNIIPESPGIDNRSIYTNLVDQFPKQYPLQLNLFSLQGGNNNFLYYLKERPSSGTAYPPTQNKARPTSGPTYPRYRRS